MRFDSLARFLGWNFLQQGERACLSECTHPACLSSEQPLGFPWLVSLCPPFSFFDILVQYLVAFHACHGELFHTHWLFIGTDHQTEQARWNNCPWKFLIAAPFCVLPLFELWHVAVACLNTRSYHKFSPKSRKVCKFWYQIFYVSLEYTAERLLFLCTTWSIVPQQDFLSDCTAHKICFSNQISDRYW